MNNGFNIDMLRNSFYRFFCLHFYANIRTSDVPFDPFDGYVDTRGALKELKAHWLPLFERLDDGKSGKSYPAINIRDIRQA